MGSAQQPVDRALDLARSAIGELTGLMAPLGQRKTEVYRGALRLLFLGEGTDRVDDLSSAGSCMACSLLDTASALARRSDASLSRDVTRGESARLVEEGSLRLHPVAAASRVSNGAG